MSRSIVPPKGPISQRPQPAPGVPMVRHITLMGDEALEEVTTLLKNTQSEMLALAELFEEMSKWSPAQLHEADFLLTGAAFRLRRVAGEHSKAWDNLKDTNPLGIPLTDCDPAPLK